MFFCQYPSKNFGFYLSRKVYDIGWKEQLEWIHQKFCEINVVTIQSLTAQSKNKIAKNRRLQTFICIIIYSSG